MNARVKVILCGNTLVLAALQASLAADPEVEVLDATDFPLDEQTLRAQQPDAVIVDDTAVQPALLRQVSTLSPGFLLVSVDSTGPRVILWSAQQAPATSTRELVELIKRSSQPHAAPHADR